jgi:hypothetical protein
MERSVTMSALSSATKSGGGTLQRTHTVTSLTAARSLKKLLFFLIRV